MLIRCSFTIIIMMDTISSASRQSTLKFPPTIGTIHHVLLHHLDSYLDHATFFSIQVWGGIHENFISASFCALYIYIYVRAYLLVDQFIPLNGFSLFVQQSLLQIYTFTTPYVTTLHVTITVMLVHGLIHDGKLRACPCALLGLMYGLR